MSRVKNVEFFIDENGCFICTSHNSKNGYGKITVNGRRKAIHRHIYEECFGELKDGEFVRHKCSNKKCINPEHMFSEYKGEGFSRFNKVINKKRAKKINFYIDNNGCFICNSHAPSVNEGYPKISINNRKMFIHRHIYEQCFGEIPKGLVVRHKCDNSMCINPEHLEVGTQRDNIQDIIDRNKSFKLAKLTVEEVREIKIRLRDGEKVSMLSKEYGVSNQTIRYIRDGKTWKNVVV